MAYYKISIDSELQPIIKNKKKKDAIKTNFNAIHNENDPCIVSLTYRCI